MHATQVLEFEALVAIAERGSFAAAATHLGLAVSTLSHRLRALEERLGVRLVNRTTRSVSLTDAGRALVVAIRPALQGLDAAVHALAPYLAGPAGPLRLTVAPPAAHSILGPRLAAFLEQHPAVALEVSVDGRPVDIVREGFDAGIRLGGRIAQDMVDVPLGPPVRVQVAASPRYLARRGTPKSPSDLRHHDCVRVRLPGGALLPWLFEMDGKMVDVDPGGSLIVNDRELELRAVLDGVGITHTLSNGLDDLIAGGALVPLLQEWLPPPFAFHLYHPSRRQTPPSLKALIQALRGPPPG